VAVRVLGDHRALAAPREHRSPTEDAGHEWVRIGEHEATARAQDTRELSDRRPDLGQVAERQRAHRARERPVGDGQHR
jgi:hypothetical protein